MALDFGDITQSRSVNHGTLGSDNFAQGSVLALVRMDHSVNSDQLILGKTGGSFNSNSWWFTSEWGLARLAFMRGRATQDCRATAVTGSVTSNVWQWVACSWDTAGSDTDQKIFVGGLKTSMAEVASYASQTVGSGTLDSVSSLNFISGGINWGFEGDMDGEVAVFYYWDTVKTLEELVAQQFSPWPLYGPKVFSHYGLYGSGVQRDLSGNSYNGTPTGSPVVSPHPGIATPFVLRPPRFRANQYISLPKGASLEFDSDTDYLQAANNRTDSDTAMTLMTWVKFTSLQEATLARYGNSERTFVMDVTNPDEVYLAVNRSIQQSSYTTTDFNATTDVWYFIAAVYNEDETVWGSGDPIRIATGTLNAIATERTLSLNTNGNGTTNALSNDTVFVGNRGVSDTRRLDGSMAFYAYFPSELSLEEIQSIQFNPLNAVRFSPDTLLLPGFHGASTVPDLSGNGDNFTAGNLSLAPSLPLPLFPRPIYGTPYTEAISNAMRTYPRGVLRGVVRGAV